MASLWVLLLCTTPFFAQNKEKKRNGDISDTREVSSFSAIDIELAADIYVRQADNYSLVAEGAESVLERIKTEVKDGKLLITTQSNWKNWNQFEKIKIYITTTTLDDLVFSGVGKVELEGKWTVQRLNLQLEGVHNVYIPNINLADLKVKFDGTGSVELGGQSEKASLIINGTGSIFANDLAVTNARCAVNGLGKLECNVTDELVADVSGMGSILYSGEPKKVRSSVNGLGKVKAQKGY